MIKIIFYFLKKYIQSFRNIYSRFDSAFMVTGLTLSVIILTSSIVLFNGYTKTLKDLLLGTNAHIYIFNTGNKNLSQNDFEILESYLLTKDEIETFSSVKTAQVLARSPNYTKGAFIRDIFWEREKLPIRYKDYVIKGTYHLKDQHSVVIGKNLADFLGLNLRDEFKITSPLNTKFTVFGLKSTELTARVDGIFQSGVYDFDSRYIFANSSFVDNFTLTPGQHEMIEIALIPELVEDADIYSRMWASDFLYSYQFSSWLDFNENLFLMLNLQKWVIFIILSFLIAISSINVISFIITSIAEKRKEIGTLQSYGMSTKAIQAIFLARGLFISIFSIVTGQLLGVLLAFAMTKQNIYTLKGEVYFLENFSVTPDIPTLLLIFFTSLTIVLVSSMIPLKTISKFTIIEIFRNN